MPEEMKTDAYLKLCKDVSLYRNAVEKRYADKEYIKRIGWQNNRRGQAASI